MSFLWFQPQFHHPCGQGNPLLKQRFLLDDYKRMWVYFMTSICTMHIEEFVNKFARLVSKLLFIYKWMRCTRLSNLVFICVWHSIVRAYKGDLLTRLQDLLPNYFYIALTLRYHTISNGLRRIDFDIRVSKYSMMDWNSTCRST